VAKKIAVILVFSLLLGTLPLQAWSGGMCSGTPAPAFQVESGNNKKITLDMVLGKVIVLYYTSRHVITDNSQLKTELFKLYRTQPVDIKKQLFQMVVVDGSEASWTTMPFWKCKLIEHSKKEGFTIFADWHKKMLADYQLKENDCNFLIIDKEGIIRYSASGKINHGQLEKIKKLLCSLVQEG